MAGHIRFNNADIGYGRETVVSGINATIPKGKLTAILGRNGSGKTTLLRSLIKLSKLNSGSISICSRNLSSLKIGELPRYLTYAPAELGDQMGFTVMDVLTSAMRGKRWVTEKEAAAALDLLGSAELVNRRFSETSSGQKKLVLIGRALASGAPIILLDEPTANLDIGNRRMIMRNVHRLVAGGETVVIATHDLEAAMSADWVIALKEGRMLGSGSRREMINKEMLYEIYGTVVEFGKVRGKLAVVQD